MKNIKVLIMPLMAISLLVSCNNNPTNPDVDILSEYTYHKQYENTTLKSEESVTWENHHIVKEEGSFYRGDKTTNIQNIYKYEGDNLTEETYKENGKMIRKAIYTYDEHNNETKVEHYENGDEETAKEIDEHTYIYENDLIKKETFTMTLTSYKDPYSKIVTSNDYDNQRRLTKKRYENYNYDDQSNVERLATLQEYTYDYQGSFKQFVKETNIGYNPDDQKTILGKVVTTNILDNRGNAANTTIERYDGAQETPSKVTKTEKTYDNDDYLISYSAYIPISTESETAFILNEQGLTKYHNNNHAQIESNITIHYKDDETGSFEGVKFDIRKYDEKNRMISRDSKNNFEGYTVAHDFYSYD